MGLDGGLKNSTAYVQRAPHCSLQSSYNSYSTCLIVPKCTMICNWLWKAREKEREPSDLVFSSTISEILRKPERKKAKLGEKAMTWV